MFKLILTFILMIMSLSKCVQIIEDFAVVPYNLDIEDLKDDMMEISKEVHDRLTILTNQKFDCQNFYDGVSKIEWVNQMQDWTLAVCAVDKWAKQNAYNTILVLADRITYELQSYDGVVSVLKDTITPVNDDNEDFGVINQPYELVLPPEKSAKIKKRFDNLIYNYEK